MGQIIKSVLVSKWCIRMRPSLVCILCATFRTNPVDFGKSSIYSFFLGVEKYSYASQPMESNYKMPANVKTEPPIDFKFGILLIN